jgi:hypothetical protein
MKNNKNGGVSFDWIFGLAFLFSLALLYVVFNHALTDEFNPVLANLIPDDAPAKNEVLLDSTEWMSYWNAVPYFLVFIVGTFWLVSAIRKEPI